MTFTFECALDESEKALPTERCESAAAGPGNQPGDFVTIDVEKPWRCGDTLLRGWEYGHSGSTRKQEV